MYQEQRFGPRFKEPVHGLDLKVLNMLGVGFMNEKCKATHLYIMSDGWKMWFWWKRMTPRRVVRATARQDGYAFARGRTD